MEHPLIFSNVPYTDSSSNALLQFDLYVPQESNTALRPVICFIHGGAWRSEDKSDHAPLARKLVASTGLSVVVANYRLTPQSPTPQTQFQHPSHAEDILQFLSFIYTWQGPDRRGRPFDSERIYLMGHSCGAHMLASIFLDSSLFTPSLTPSPHILRSVRSIVLSEGIYDIDALLVRFPKYRTWFIEHAFGDKDSYSEASVVILPARNTSIRWLIIHSTDDELIDLSQSENMYRHLRQLYAAVPQIDSFVKTVIGEFGRHDDTLGADDFIGQVASFIKD